MVCPYEPRDNGRRTEGYCEATSTQEKGKVRKGPRFRRALLKKKVAKRRGRLGRGAPPSNRSTCMLT
eukprot:11220331-Lingulodinium_polyedra.AAC.1